MFAPKGGFPFQPHRWSNAASYIKREPLRWDFGDLLIDLFSFGAEVFAFPSEMIGGAVFFCAVVAGFAHVLIELGYLAFVHLASHLGGSDDAFAEFLHFVID